MKPRLIGCHGRAVARGGPHREDADERRQHPDAHHDQRESHPEDRVAPYGREGAGAQDERRHQDHPVGLEEVGAHAGAVADIVAHVVGDGGGVAGVVLRDARFHLADQVRPHVGGLGVNASAHTHEQR